MTEHQPSFNDNPLAFFNDDTTIIDEHLRRETGAPFQMGVLFARYDDANFVMRSRDFGRTYWFGLEKVHGRCLKNEYAFAVMEHWLVSMNPPAHARLRKLMQHPFSSGNIDALALDKSIGDIADVLIHQIKMKGQFDLVKDFALPLPVLVMCQMLGIPSDDAAQFIKEPMVPARVVDAVPFDRMFLDEVNAKFEQLRDYFYPLFEERRKNPRNDLMSMMVNEQQQGDRLSEAELLSNIILLFFAGHETTASLIATGLRELFLRPDQLALLRAYSSLMENAVYEMLRLVSVAQVTVNTAFKDVLVNGTVVKQHTPAWCWLAAANRDPRVFKNPHELDVTRENAKAMLAFGGGIHYCLGAHLAKLETKIAIQKLLDAFPALILENLEHPKWRNSLSLRALDEQPARIE